MSEKHNVFEDVYQVVALIPYGRVSSYGAIARYLGIKSARMVGWAMNSLHNRPEIPAHRVVNSKGILSGAAAFDKNRPMSALLAEEGIHVLDNRIVDFQARLWDPNAEL